MVRVEDNKKEKGNYMDKNNIGTVNFLTEMSEFTFVSKYARYNPAAERRETWEECVGRTEAMHLNKFKKVLPKEDLKRVEQAFNAVREKQVVPSMRSLQYSGKALMANELRGYNCSMRHLDSIRAFAEIMFLSMSGCGIGIGLYKKFINRLPDLVNADDKTGTIITYVVEDTSEGWSDSFEALLNCYMKNTAYTGRKIVYDYSRVRKAGSPLKTSGGKAPGHKGLKNAHSKIKERLDYIIEELNLTRLRSIDIYDILMHSVDATLSGGSRRSATIVLFDKDDMDMMQAKTNFTVSKHTRFALDKDINRWCGRITINKKKYEVELTDFEYNDLLLKQNQISWIHIEPQRARSNNTIRLVREETTQEEVDALIEHTKMYGEPGFFFVNKAADDALCNPCLSSSVSVTCVDSVKSIADVQVGEKIWSSEGWTTVIQKWNNGLKPTFKYVTEKGVIEATANHKFMSRGVKTAAKDCEDIDFNDGIFYPVVDVVATGEQAVFDIAVDNQSHTFYANGFNVSNCAEIVTIPITKDGVCGVQNCNLTEINGKALTSLADLIQATENAAIIGTLQAAYTKFKYLGNASREITEEEALLGISITGLLDNPKICLNEEYLTTAAQWACATNELWAKKLGINPAARLTCIKPSGTVGVVLQTSSGIHPHHANKYFRRIQCNKHDPVFQYFKKYNPHMVEESVWSANKTDEVVTFPIYVNGETIVKKDLTALQHMEMIKKVYNAWVKPGTSKYNKKPITHNISCTVLVKDDEWADVSKYLYENRDAFTAMSFLPAIGDKLYKQAPFESVITEEDEAKYQALIASYKPVDYKKLKELEDTTTIMDTIACAGGSCQL